MAEFVRFRSTATPVLVLLALQEFTVKRAMACSGRYDPPEAERGDIFCSNSGPPYPLGTICAHSCNNEEGFFRKSGDEVRTCQEGRVWDGDDLVCVAYETDPTVACAARTDPPANERGTFFCDNSGPPYPIGTVCTHSCDNLEGFFLLSGDTQRTCREGGSWHGEDVTCTEDDPCADGTDNCHDDAICTNTDNGFTCACNDGYGGDGLTCTDVDECAGGTDNCHADATCTNTPGAFTCDCYHGYDGDGVTCTDVDECAADTDNCHADATCTNTPGAFICACNAGYDGDGLTCTDVDECATGTDICHANATCTNTPGAFTCACNAGYDGDGVTCTDIDECTEGTENCHDQATCTNTAGSFICTCNDGYSGDGVNCTGVDECLSNPCANGGTCEDEVNGYTCTCAPGYVGDHCERATRLIPFDGNLGPIIGGLSFRRRREATSTHWSRVGNVTSLVYDADSGAEEQLVSFAARNLKDLGENDHLLGPLQSLTRDVDGFPTNYPATTTEAMPSLVQHFRNMLDSFDCGSDPGPNCGLKRGLDDVVKLDDHWYIVYRPAIEYDPGSTKRGIRFRILIVAWRGFRIFIRCFIY
ncbi:fibrillin-1-like [Branchiostoma lanceolatum]|uniref:fibrillin-1-like n=1 Tax=Branchiostoma lanceolatum TaxID=7740 RepID=UPI003455A355